jgi:hypothetical protein
MSLYIVELSVSLCFVNNVYYVYIPYFNVTSSGIKCSKGTPIIKKSNPSLFIGGRTKQGGKKSWHWTNIWPWVPAGLDARNDRVGWLPTVSYCSALTQYVPSLWLYCGADSFKCVPSTAQNASRTPESTSISSSNLCSKIIKTETNQDA